MTWTRRRFLATTSLVTAAAALPWNPRSSWMSSALAQEASGSFETLRRNIGIFNGQGGTIGWLVADDALVVVDTQFPATAATCWQGLDERSERQIDLLINSHHHGDHTAGNAVFQPHAKTFVAHANVPVWQKKATEARGNTEGQAYASTTYEDHWQSDLGSEKVRLDYYGRAHTSGDSVIHFEKADVVHMGDLVFNRYPAFIDRPAGATIEGWMQLLEKVHARFSDDTLFIHGHGNPEFGVTGGRADLLHMRDFLGALLEYAQKGIQAGKSEDEVASALKLPGFEEHYAESWKVAIPNCLRVAHQEVREGA